MKVYVVQGHHAWEHTTVEFVCATRVGAEKKVSEIEDYKDINCSYDDVFITEHDVIN